MPMLDNVREAFMQEKKYQEEKGILCQVRSRWIYRFCVCVPLRQYATTSGTLNKALRRIMRDCNQRYWKRLMVRRSCLLPSSVATHSSMHFTTRLCESESTSRDSGRVRSCRISALP